MRDSMESVSRILFGQEESNTLAQAYVLIASGDRAVDATLLKLMAKQQDEMIVAKITAARAVSIPLDVDYWLRDLNHDVFGDQPLFEMAPGQLVHGIVLGLFEAATWFDQQRRSTIFLDHLPDVCYRIIVCKNRLQQCADTLQVEADYKGRLTNAIKAYAKGMPESKGKRLADIQTIIAQVADHSRSHDEQIGTFGNIILDQLTYALFNQIAPFARAMALADFFEKQLGLSK